MIVLIHLFYFLFRRSFDHVSALKEKDGGMEQSVNICTLFELYYICNEVVIKA